MVHFTRLLTTLSLVLGCVMSVNAHPKPAAPLDGSTTTSLKQSRGLERRQAIIQGTVCANVPIRVNVGTFGTQYVSLPHVDKLSGEADSDVIRQTLINSICLCAEAGVLVCPCFS